MSQRWNGHKRVHRNHSNAIPRYILAFDTETRRIQDAHSPRRYHHVMRLGVAQYARIVGLKPTGLKTVPFTDGSEFWSLLENITRPNYTTWVVGHNILFDLIQVGMPDVFERGEYTIDWPRSKRKREDNSTDNAHCWTYCIVDDPTTIIAAKCSKTQGRVVFVDLMNWFPMPLRKIGEALGLPKLTMPDWDASDFDWFEYCQRDTEITFRAFVDLISWVKENDFGMFRYTAPSQANAAFRHRFMDENIYTHDCEPIRKAERESFFGGRSEVWKLGEIDSMAFQYDVNSLYPYVMLQGEFPIVLDRFEERAEPTDDLPLIDYSKATAVVELDTKEPNYPLRTESGVIYPIGKFVTTLCGAELERAYYKRIIRKVGTWAEYRTKPIFRRWVHDLWELRKGYQASGDTLYDLFAKFLMNSLFGKFAQRTARWQNVPDIMPNLPWSHWREVNVSTGIVEHFRSFGYQVQRECEREEVENTFIAISAFVSAAGRILMNSYRGVAGPENVFYQGVDSLIVNASGANKLNSAGLLSETELGKFKLQIATDTGCIHGVSDYVIGQRVVVAGKPMRQADSERELDLVRRFDIKGGLFAGEPASNVLEELSEWRRAGKYWKGVVDESGCVHPIELT